MTTLELPGIDTDIWRVRRISDDDGLDAFRCTMFRNEGPQLASDLIREAMRVTLERMPERPPDGWLTYIEPRHIASPNPGYCFKRAGWWRDRTYTPGYRQRHLIRLRAAL